MKSASIDLAITVIALFLLILPTRPAIAQDLDKILEKADHFYLSAEFEECIRLIEPLHRQHKGTSWSYHLQGKCQDEIGNHEIAITLYTTSLNMGVMLAGNYYERAHAFLALERYADAALDFEAYLKIDPREREELKNKVVLNYAYCLSQTGEVPHAIDYLEKYPGKDAQLLNALAHYYDTFQGNEEKAMYYWKETLKEDPAHRSALENLSISYYNADHLVLAFENIEKLIELYPDYGRGYWVKGLYLDGIGEEGDALMYFSKARELGYEDEVEE